MRNNERWARGEKILISTIKEIIVTILDVEISEKK